MSLFLKLQHRKQRHQPLGERQLKLKVGSVSRDSPAVSHPESSNAGDSHPSGQSAEHFHRAGIVAISLPQCVMSAMIPPGPP